MRKALALAALLAAGLAACAWWLFFTPGGLSFALSALSRLAPAKVTAASLSGRLADSFELRGLKVRFTWVPVVVSIDRLKVEWRPTRLLGGALDVEDLEAAGAVIDDDRPETKGIAIEWPRASGFLAGLQAWINRFEGGPVLYRRRGQAVFSTDRLSFRAAWHHGMVDFESIAFEGRLSGSGRIAAGFVSPFLRTDLSLAFAKEGGGLDRAALGADLRAGRGKEVMAGTVRADAKLGRAGSAGAEGRVGISEREVTFSGLLLTYSGVTGRAEAEGRLDLTGERPLLSVHLRLTDLRRTEGAGSRLSLSGIVDAAGDREAYSGTYRLTAKPVKGAPSWQAAQAAGKFEGTAGGVAAKVVRGAFLGGSVTGDIEARWQEGLALASSLRARGLDTALLSSRWEGRVNADLDAKASLSHGSARGAIRASLPGSVLSGRPLDGRLALSFEPGQTRFDYLDVEGRGFDFRASGVLERRLSFETEAADLSFLFPGTKGSLSARGALALSAGVLSGSIEGQAGGLSGKGVHIGQASFSGRLAKGAGGRVGLDVACRDIGYGAMEAAMLRLQASGTRGSHRLALDLREKGTAVRLAFRGGLVDGRWDGVLEAVSGSDALGPFRSDGPAALSVSAGRVVLSGLRLSSAKGETLRADADIVPRPLRGSFDAVFEDIELSRSRPFIKRGSIRGRVTGSLRARVPQEGAGLVECRIEGKGSYAEKEVFLPLSGLVDARWDAEGLASRWEIARQGGGRARGTLSASGPPRPALPQSASLHASFEDVDAALLAPWMPEAFSLKGRLSGETDGELSPGRTISAKGSIGISRGSIAWARRAGSASAAIETGSVAVSWSGGDLRGDLALTLASYGKVAGSFSLPLPARLPPAFVRDGPLRVSLSAEVREKGLLSAIMPGVMQETKGMVVVGLTAGGTWAEPKLAGTASLKDASVLLPQAGVRIERLAAEATLSGNSVHVARIRAESGGGWVEVVGDATLGKGGLSYEGTARGEGFQVLNRPDLRAYASPRLSFHGDSKLFAARGEILVPRMAIYGMTGENVVRPSPDIVIVEEARQKTSFPLGLDIAVHVILGDKVIIRASGIDATLTGGLDVRMSAPEKVDAHGTIAAKGGYRAYGVRLTITRGNIVFDGPVETPALDILAVRKTDDVTAGVAVTGTAKTPIVNLYSNRPMSDADKLAYVVLGHRMSTADPSQSALFTSGADVFEGGATPAAVSQARQRLGLETVPGAMPQQAAGSTLSVGRYLAPGFYVGIGRSLLTGENLVTLRYKLTKRWEVESMVGGATGMDLFYRIEFE